MIIVHCEPRATHEDYSRLTTEDNDRIMREILGEMEHETLVGLLMDHAYEEMYEELNEETIGRFCNEYDERHGAPLDERDRCDHAECGRPATNLVYDGVILSGQYCDEHCDERLRGA